MYDDVGGSEDDLEDFWTNLVLLSARLQPCCKSDGINSTLAAEGIAKDLFKGC